MYFFNYKMNFCNEMEIFYQSSELKVLRQNIAFTVKI